MDHAHKPSLDSDKLILGPVGPRIGIPALLIGLLALLIAGRLAGFPVLPTLGGLWQHFGVPLQPTTDQSHSFASHFFHSYLAAYSFFMAITLGCLLFVLIHHATRAGWSTTVRRLAEGLSLNIFLMFILLLPLFIPVDDGSGLKESGIYYLLHWLDQAFRSGDALIQAKIGYMNPTFFFIRILAYFIVWGFTAWFFASQSVTQDHTGNPKITTKLSILSAPCIIFSGFALTGFAFDWIMALNPHWFSTIFGVYYFAGCMLSAFSTITLLALYLQKKGLIKHAVTHEHYHDLGKWMFAFTFFWGYIAFAQYMLIWYSNIPEETQFFIPRQIGLWSSISLCLLAVHLLIPFPGLLSRHMKRKNSFLAFWAVWSICACALDMYWLIIPSQWINKIPTLVGNPEMPLQNALPLLAKSTHNIYQIKDTFAAAPYHFNDQINYPLQPLAIVITILCFIGIGGIYLFSTTLALRGKPLVPTKDPRLTESLAFENI